MAGDGPARAPQAAGSGWAPFRSRGRAKFAFEAGGRHQISLREGDYVQIQHLSPEGWFKGLCVESGESGIFPAAFVALIDEADEAAHADPLLESARRALQCWTQGDAEVPPEARALAELYRRAWQPGGGDRAEASRPGAQEDQALRAGLVRELERHTLDHHGWLLPRDASGAITQPLERPIAELYCEHVRRIAPAAPCPTRVDVVLRFDRCGPALLPLPPGVQLLVTPYSADRREPLGEGFVLALGPDGQPSGGAAAATAVFINVPCDERAQGGLCLVAWLVRLGPLMPTASDPAADARSPASPTMARSDQATYQRPFAVGLWRIRGEHLDCSGQSFTIQTDRLEVVAPRDEAMAPRLYSLLQSAAGLATATSRAPSALHASVRIEPSRVNEPRAGLVMRSLQPTELPAAHELRNDLYVTLIRATVLQDKKRSAKNVLVRVFVVAANRPGVFVPAIMRSGNAEPTTTYESTVYYHDNKPSFAETVVVRVPAGDRLVDHTLLFLLCHASTTHKRTHTFSFAVLPLASEAGQLREGGPVELACFQPPRGTRHTGDAATLASQALSGASGHVRHGIAARPEESLQVSLRVVSSEESSEPHLHNLLRWDSFETLEEATAVFEYASRDLAKPLARAHFWRLLDASLHALDASEDDRLVAATFRFLINLFAQAGAQDSHLVKRLETVVEDFVKHTLDRATYATSVYIGLLGCTRLWLDDLCAAVRAASDGAASHHDLEGNPKTFLSALPFIIRLIVSSRVADVAREQGALRARIDSEQFVQRLVDIFLLLQEVGALELPEAVLPGAPETRVDEVQEKLLESAALTLTFGLSDSEAVLPEETRGEIARGFIESAQDTSEQVAEAKLRLVAQLCCSPVLESRACRVRVIAPFVRTIQSYLYAGNPVHQDQCTECVLRLLRTLQDRRLCGPERGEAFRANVWNASMLLPGILKTLAGSVSAAQERKADQQVGTVQAALCSAALSIVADMDESMKRSYLQTLAQEEGPAATAEFTRNALQACAILTEPQDRPWSLGAFPNSWLAMQCAACSGATELLLWLPPILQNVPGATTSKVWVQFVRCAVRLMAIAVELQRLRKDPTIARLASQPGVQSVAERLGPVVQAAWDGPLRACESLSEMRGLARPLLSICAASEKGGPAALARRLLLGVLSEELASTGALASAEGSVIDFVEGIALRERFSSVGQRTVELFTVHLRTAREAHEQPALAAFLDQTAELYRLLCQLDALPFDPAHEDECAEAILHLVAHLHGMHRMSKYAEYVERLGTLHQACGNTAEAANAHLLLADIEGTGTGTGPRPGEGPVSSGTGALLWRAFELFSQGQYWAEARQVLARLRRLHESETFALAQVGRALRAEAALCDKMASSMVWTFPQYFRVIFRQRRGDDALEHLYVYKGAELETAEAFTARLQQRHPEARVSWSSRRALTSAGSATSAGSFEVQSLNVASLFDLAILGASSADRARAAAFSFALEPLQLLRQREHQQAQWFSSVTSFRKAEHKSGSDVLDTWVVKHYVRASVAFPGLCRRAGVERTETVEIDPLRLAVESVYRKNCELLQGIRVHERSPDCGGDQTLTMLLNGVIDAAVNGGALAHYGTFLQGRYPTEHPEILQAYPGRAGADAWVAVLERLLCEQVSLLEEALRVHKRVCAVEVRPLHAHLEESFATMRARLQGLRLALGEGI